MKHKLLNLNRVQEKERQKSVYTYYNTYARSTVDRGELLTDFKNHIAQNFGYKNYQVVANLISRFDRQRRADISNELKLLTKELFVDIKACDNTQSILERVISRDGIYSFYVRVFITHDFLENHDRTIVDFGITGVQINLLQAYQGDIEMFLNNTDKKMIEDFLQSKMIFKITPNPNTEVAV